MHAFSKLHEYFDVHLSTLSTFLLYSTRTSKLSISSYLLLFHYGMNGILIAGPTYTHDVATSVFQLTPNKKGERAAS